MRARRRTALVAAGVAVALVAVLVIVLAGGDDEGPAERRTVGRGAKSAVILTPRDAPAGPLPAVIFIHGWRALETDEYGAWLDHLVEEGNVVIYPVYEPRGFSFPGQWLNDVLTGVAAALEEVEVRPRTLVVAGHSAGGALAADYAATARSAGLPAPEAVFSVYPGRSARGIPGSIPQPDPAAIPPTTHVLAVAGDDDRVVRAADARAIVADAVRVPPERRRFELITDDAVDDHRAPQRSDEPARRAFWARFDRLIAEARGS